MQDPLVTLRAAIAGAWTLTGNLALKSGSTGYVLLSTGWYDRDFEGPQVTITEVTDVDRCAELGYGRVRVSAVYQVDVWVKIAKATGKGPGLAKQYLWQLREEVKRILKTKLVGLTDLQYVELNDVGRRLDELDKALLRYSKQFGVIYDI